jgi:hypothetical protein
MRPGLGLRPCLWWRRGLRLDWRARLSRGCNRLMRCRVALLIRLLFGERWYGGLDMRRSLPALIGLSRVAKRRLPLRHLSRPRPRQPLRLPPIWCGALLMLGRSQSSLRSHPGGSRFAPAPPQPLASSASRNRCRASLCRRRACRMPGPHRRRRTFRPCRRPSHPPLRSGSNTCKRLSLRIQRQLFSR